MVMGLQRLTQKRSLRVWTCILLSTVLFSLAACGGSTTPGTGVGTATNSPLTVWVDATRLPGIKLYQTAHPNVKLNIVTFDRTGNGGMPFPKKSCWIIALVAAGPMWFLPNQT